VRTFRKAKGWTQEELAARTARHPTYIGGIERGERNVTVQVIADLARALGVRMSALFE
jgi:transcriptional regulator with XRE-family HTH domain